MNNLEGFAAYQYEPKVTDLYQQGYSACEIKEELKIPISVRSLQRYIKLKGIMRSVGDAFRNAVKKGRVTYRKNPNKLKRIHLNRTLRYKILERDEFKCVKCGADAKISRIQIDHIDNNKNNNVESNLQTLCEDCNQGKAHLDSSRKNNIKEFIATTRQPIKI